MAAGRGVAGGAVGEAGMVYINIVPIAGVVTGSAWPIVMGIGCFIPVAVEAIPGPTVVKIGVIPVIGIMAFGALTVIVVGPAMADLAIIKAGVAKEIIGPVNRIMAI